MFAFLGIIARDDFEKGITFPSYYLCKTTPRTGYTAGYRVVAADCKFRNSTKVLVTTLTGHEDLIEYMSCFRTAYYPRNKKKLAENRKRIFVRGALCWFPCNRFGERIGDQPPIFITMVPLKERKAEKGKTRMEEIRKRKRKLNSVLAEEKNALIPDTFNVKRKLPETSIGRRHANDEDEREGNDERDQWGEVGF